jgi:hypothetical protein
MAFSLSQAFAGRGPPPGPASGERAGEREEEREEERELEAQEVEFEKIRLRRTGRGSGPEDERRGRSGPTTGSRLLSRRKLHVLRVKCQGEILELGLTEQAGGEAREKGPLAPTKKAATREPRPS